MLVNMICIIKIHILANMICIGKIYVCTNLVSKAISYWYGTRASCHQTTYIFCLFEQLPSAGTSKLICVG